MSKRERVRPISIYMRHYKFDWQWRHAFEWFVSDLYFCRCIANNCLSIAWQKLDVHLHVHVLYMCALRIRSFVEICYDYNCSLNLCSLLRIWYHRKQILHKRQNVQNKHSANWKLTYTCTLHCTTVCTRFHLSLIPANLIENRMKREKKDRRLVMFLSSLFLYLFNSFPYF